MPGIVEWIAATEEFRGRPMAVIGSGWSLAGFDFSRIAHIPRMVLNDAIEAVPDGDLHVWGDGKLVARYAGRKYSEKTRLVIQSSSLVRFTRERNAAGVFPSAQELVAATYEASGGRHEVENHPEFLLKGYTVATAGIHLAARLGATPIILLGCDACAPAKPGTGYYWDGRPSTHEARRVERLRAPNGEIVLREDRHAEFSKSMEELRRMLRVAMPSHCRIVVWNASPVSLIEAWPRRTIEECLADVENRDLSRADAGGRLAAD